ncbi:hypothetical protein DFA_04980 [Cavenderia fasciculata]|uniref:Ankyrin repeat-containing protein n=1 Tax=Cavenderia fasciculata TaxID=261658 RepID=F4PMQ3_CACFS|nr:uncharacterized protein DFA_04980 [Cavenderia fasciculata]EGG22850.1 hypothetical protein DFA_04980 [Cavenderia fasciculata]|eukprot:XP_004360701.1 hypothetical protein DFA_04980 [Cavenderia fasciculata]
MNSITSNNNDNNDNVSDSNNNKQDERKSEIFKSIFNNKYLRTMIMRETHHHCPHFNHHIISLNECILLNHTNLFIQKNENRVAFDFVVDRLGGLPLDFIQFLSNEWKPMEYSILRDILNNSTDNKERYYANCHHLKFKNLINKLNQQQQPQDNNNNDDESKYQIIYYMVKKLLEYGMDLRVNLFVDALECDNNQDIIKWIKDSFGGKSIDNFDFFKRNYVLIPIIERYASLETLKLLEFPPIFYPMSTTAAMYGNKGFISYIITHNYKYVYHYPQIETALKEGQLECVYLLNDAILKFDKLGDKGYCRIDLFYIDSIHPSIMSLDLVKLLGANPFLRLTVKALALSAISAKQLDTLNHILSCNGQDVILKDQDKSSFVVGALYVDNTSIIEYLLNRLYPNSSGSITFQVTTDNLYKMVPQSLEYLYSKTHSLDIKVPPTQHTLITTTTKKQPIDIPLSFSQILELIVSRQPINTIEPCVILSRFGYFDSNIQVLTDVLPRLSWDGWESPVKETIITASKNGLVNVLKCLVTDFDSFVDSFTAALKYHQINVVEYLIKEHIALFITITDNRATRARVQLLSLFFFKIDDDQRFASFWNDFKPLTTNSDIVSQIMCSSPLPQTHRHRNTLTIDRIIQNYSRFYNGPERDQYQMKTLLLETNRDQHPFNVCYIVKRYRHDENINNKQY